MHRNETPGAAPRDGAKKALREGRTNPPAFTGLAALADATDADGRAAEPERPAAAAERVRRMHRRFRTPRPVPEFPETRHGWEGLDSFSNEPVQEGFGSGAEQDAV